MADAMDIDITGDDSQDAPIGGEIDIDGDGSDRRHDVDPGTEPPDQPQPIPDGWLPDRDRDAGQAGEAIVNPSTPPPDDGYQYVAKTRTSVNAELIQDYSSLHLTLLEQSGAVPWAILDDGTEVQVTWADVSDPAGPDVTAVNEAAEVAAAINQHFWNRSADAGQDGAGTGAFVTDEEQEAFLEAAAAGFPDQGEAVAEDSFTGDGTAVTFTLSQTALPETVAVTIDGAAATAFTATTTAVTFDAAPAEGAAIAVSYGTGKRPWHNLLMNSLGILLRTGMRNLVSITRSAIAFFDGMGNSAQNVVARFGKDGYQVGVRGQSHMIGDYHSLQLIDEENEAYFHVSDTRSREGITTVKQVKMPDSATDYIILDLSPVIEILSVTIDGTEVTGYTFKNNTVKLPRSTILEIAVIYVTSSPDAKAFTFGNRKASEKIGPRSFTSGVGVAATGYGSTAFGDNVTASGKFSRAEGSLTVASGEGAHAEGYGSKATGLYSHAEGHTGRSIGAYSHAEGYVTNAPGHGAHSEGERTVASGNSSHAEGGYCKSSGVYSHAEGAYTEASGNCSHASGSQTIAASYNQTVIGKYNVKDEDDRYALIIGNGVGARSNALNVRWEGFVEVGNEVNANSSQASAYGLSDNTWLPLFLWDSNHTSPASYTGNPPISPCFIYYIPENALYYCTDN